MSDLWRRRAASVLEVLGVYSAGPLAMYGLRHALGVSVTNMLTPVRSPLTVQTIMQHCATL
jgi:hypothetical protein